MKIRLMILGLICSCILHAQSNDSLFRKASRLYEEEDWKPALMTMNTLIKKDPTQASYYELRGKIWYELEKRTNAIEDISKAIGLDPQNPLFYHFRAILFYSIQEPDYSIEDNNLGLKYCVNNDSLKYGLILNRGNAYAMKREFLLAYEDYKTILSVDSTNISALTNIGSVLDDLERSQESINYLEKAIRYHPEFVGPYVNLGLRYAELGNYSKALELMNKAVELDPAEALGYNNRGYIKYKLGDLDGAMKDINKSLGMYPSNSYAYRNRALVWVAKKNSKEACKDINRALEYGFTEMYGKEMVDLQLEQCNN